jgi:hypothetical protein
MYAIDFAALPVAPAEPVVGAAADVATEQTEVEPAVGQQNETIEQGEGETLVPDSLPDENGETSEEKSFGAPIAEPILDPERHGG